MSTETTSINLEKGSRVDLTKTNPTIKKFNVGLGWNVNGSVGNDFDLDVSAFILGENKKRVSDAHFVFYKNLKSPNDFVVHTGDNRTGQGDGDDESLIVDFSKATPQEKSIVFVVTIYQADERKQNFGQVSGAYIRICDAETGNEIMKFDLQEYYSTETAMVFGELYEKDGEWRFAAVGQGMKGGLQDYLNLY